MVLLLCIDTCTKGEGESIMAKKDYEAHQARLNAFRNFVISKEWTIVEEKEIDYGYQFAISDGLTKNFVDFFPSGKILVQGKDGKLKTALQEWKQEATSQSLQKNEQFQFAFADMPLQSLLQSPQFKGIARIGTDEAGKGDYFGPLVMGAVYINAQTETQLIKLGVGDSKLLSDIRILTLAEEIKKLCPHIIITINPKRYNEAYEKIQNLNSLLAWGYARALESLLEKVTCDHAIADQFGNEAVLQKALKQKGRQIKLVQMPHTEVDIAVAAASILARSEFVQQTVWLSIKMGIPLPKGASESSIVTVGREIVTKHGKEALTEVAKFHFSITEKIVQH